MSSPCFAVLHTFVRWQTSAARACNGITNLHYRTMRVKRMGHWSGQYWTKRDGQAIFRGFAQNAQASCCLTGVPKEAVDLSLGLFVGERSTLSHKWEPGHTSFHQSTDAHSSHGHNGTGGQNVSFWKPSTNLMTKEMNTHFCLLSSHILCSSALCSSVTTTCGINY